MTHISFCIDPYYHINLLLEKIMLKKDQTAGALCYYCFDIVIGLLSPLLPLAVVFVEVCWFGTFGGLALHFGSTN